MVYEVVKPLYGILLQHMHY